MPVEATKVATLFCTLKYENRKSQSASVSFRPDGFRNLSLKFFYCNLQKHYSPFIFRRKLLIISILRDEWL